MSSADDEDASAPEEVLRTVTPPYWGRRDREMNVIGWGYFLGLLIVLVPLLPFMLIVWLTGKVLDALESRRAT
jgi:hypothetical protein